MDEGGLLLGFLKFFDDPLSDSASLLFREFDDVIRGVSSKGVKKNSQEENQKRENNQREKKTENPHTWGEGREIQISEEI